MSLTLEYKFKLFIVSFFFLSLLKAQSKEAFNIVYKETYLKTSQTDFNKALVIADSLYNFSKEPYYKAKSLMLSATLLQSAGEVKKSIDFALEAQKIMENSENHIQSSEIYGFLASSYRNLSLYDQFLFYINRAAIEAELIKDNDIKNNYLGLIMKENATYQIDLKNYKKAIDLISKSDFHFRVNKTNNNIFLASNEELYGLCYYKLDDFNLALIHYMKGLNLLESDNFIKGYIYNGIANIYIKKEKLSKAKKYIVLTQKIEETTQHLELRKRLYKTYQEYYILEKNLEMIKEVKIKEEILTDLISSKKLAFINNEQTNLQNKNNKLANKNSIFLFLIIFGIIILIILLIGYKNLKQNNNKLFAIIEKTKSKKNIYLDRNLKKLKPEVEEKILQKLDEFEKSTQYIQKNISLATLSIYCDTNTKYLSLVINSNKHKDFNNYINELRIKYLVHIIHTDSNYLKYKISSLANIVGFSTQSKFIEAFKKEMNITPSVYIKNIENNKPEHD